MDDRMITVYYGDDQHHLYYYTDMNTTIYELKSYIAEQLKLIVDRIIIYIDNEIAEDEYLHDNCISDLSLITANVTIPRVKSAKKNE
jgi:hypothetical protein